MHCFPESHTPDPAFDMNPVKDLILHLDNCQSGTITKNDTPGFQDSSVLMLSHRRRHQSIPHG